MSLTSIDDLRLWIAGDPALEALLVEVERRQDGDPGHDLGHLLRVTLWTLRLGEDRVDRRSAIAAALLHDVVNLPKDSSQRERAGELSAEVARELLPRLAFSPAAVEEIATAIRDHGYSRGAVPESELGRALQDADRLDALGALGVFRTLACGVRLGAELFDPDDPWAEQRPLDDRRFSLDHFFTKLLELPATMRTAAGRHEAERRVEFMRQYLRQLGEEIGHQAPAR